MSVVEEAKKQDKLKTFHEKKLTSKVQTIFRQMAKDLKNRYISSGVLLDTSVYEPEFKAVLTNRARLVSESFKKTYRETKGLEEDISVDIADFIALFIDRQIDFISATTEAQQRDMLGQVFTDLRVEGIQPTNEIIAQRLSEKFLRSGMARSQIISSEVVSGTAEETKDIEIAGLITAGVVAAGAITKTWSTTLDGRERDTHHQAHMQKRSVGQPFSVGGSLLLYPKDTSLGAAMKEIFNCRCSAIYM